MRREKKIFEFYLHFVKSFRKNQLISMKNQFLIESRIECILYGILYFILEKNVL